MRAVKRTGGAEENLGEKGRVVTDTSSWLDVRSAMPVYDRRESGIDHSDDLVLIEAIRELDPDEIARTHVRNVEEESSLARALSLQVHRCAEAFDDLSELFPCGAGDLERAEAALLRENCANALRHRDRS